MLKTYILRSEISGSQSLAMFKYRRYCPTAYQPISLCSPQQCLKILKNPSFSNIRSIRHFNFCWWILCKMLGNCSLNLESVEPLSVFPPLWYACSFIFAHVSIHLLCFSHWLVRSSLNSFDINFCQLYEELIFHTIEIIRPENKRSMNLFYSLIR